jgi:hypothetical protein
MVQSEKHQNPTQADKFKKIAVVDPAAARRAPARLRKRTDWVDLGRSGVIWAPDCPPWQCHGTAMALPWHYCRKWELIVAHLRIMHYTVKVL